VVHEESAALKLEKSILQRGKSVYALWVVNYKLIALLADGGDNSWDVSVFPIADVLRAR